MSATLAEEIPRALALAVAFGALAVIVRLVSGAAAYVRKRYLLAKFDTYMVNIQHKKPVAADAKILATSYWASEGLFQNARVLLLFSFLFPASVRDGP